MRKYAIIGFVIMKSSTIDAARNCNPRTEDFLEISYPSPGGCVQQNEGGSLTGLSRDACIQACIADPGCIAVESLSDGLCYLSYTCTIQTATYVDITGNWRYFHLVCPPPPPVSESTCAATDVKIVSTWDQILYFNNEGGSLVVENKVSMKIGVTTTTGVEKTASVGVQGTVKALSVSAGYEQKWVKSLVVENEITKESLILCPPKTECTTYQENVLYEFRVNGIGRSCTIKNFRLYQKEGDHSPPPDTTKEVPTSQLPDDACKVNKAALSSASNAVVLGISIIIALVSSW
jgi:hypothetical protein